MSNLQGNRKKIETGIIVLAIATATLHFFLLFPDFLFILNALGYLTLLAALLLPIPVLKKYRSLVRYGFIFYTLLTIALYFIMNPIGEYSAYGLFTKTVELGLVFLLYKYSPRYPIMP